MNAGRYYREAAVAGASPVRLVILLYEQAVEDLRRALSAQNNGEIEVRTAAINHAILVLGHLQASLDKDRGGSVAANLDRFYTQVREGLVEAQVHQSASAIERQISFLMNVHEAWCGVEKAVVIPSPQTTSAEVHPSTDWSA